MHKIGDSTNTADSNGEWREGSAAGGIPATLITGAWLNSVQRELIGVLEQAGIAPSLIDDKQLAKAVMAIAGSAADFLKLKNLPTTLEGYGITDAVRSIASQVNGAVSDLTDSQIVIMADQTTDRPAAAPYAVGLHMKYPEGKIGLTLLSGVTNEWFGIRRVNKDGGGAYRKIYTDADFDHQAIAPIDSPVFKGTPKVPTAAQGTASQQAASTEFVRNAINALVNGAPGALDALNELAAAIGNDPNFASTMNAVLATKAPLDSPALSGKPKAPTASAQDNSDQIANTAFVQSMAALKAPLDSPALSGKPKAPTASAQDNSDQIANTAFVRSVAAALVGEAPGALATLAALARAIDSDPNFASNVASSLARKAPLDSPALSGIPRTPTPSLLGGGDSSDQIANTLFVQFLLAAKAPLDSPALSGTPKTPTASPTTNNDQIASTAFVQSVLAAFLPKRSYAGNDFIRIPDVPGGLILQFGSAVVSPEASYDLTLPIAFNSFLGAVAGLGVSGATDQGNYVAYAVPVSKTTLRLTQDVSSRTTAGNQVVYYLAWGN